MKITPSLKMAWLAIGMFAIGACTRDLSEEVLPSPDSEKELRLTVVVPRNTSNATRAITATEENTIQTVDVLAYRIDGTNETFEYSTTGTLAPDNTAGSATQTFIASLRIADYPQRLVVITNGRTQVNTMLNTGDWRGADKATMLAGLRYDLPGGQDRWNAASPSDYAAMPMWGESNPETITSTSRNLSAAVNLMRMVARIDVQLDATVEGLTDRFKLKSVALYNTNTGGRIVPDADKVVDEQRDGDRYLRVDEATVPVDLQPYTARYTGPINYTDFTPPGVTDVSMTGAIYTFESTATQTPDSQATCLVVGGMYDTDVTPTYYRVEFYASGTQTRLDLLRNHRYVVNITSVGGRGHATVDEAFNSAAVNMTASVLVWNQPGLDNIDFNGQNTMATDKNQITLFGNEYTATSPTADNTLMVFTDVPAGWTVERVVDAADRTTSVTWLSLVPDTGAANTTVTTAVAAAQNTTGDSRSAIIYLAAGRLRKPIYVTQNYQQALAMDIVDNTDQPVTELIFSGGAGVTPAPRSFTVNWLPVTSSVNVAVSQAAQYEFPNPGGNGAPQNGAITSPSGTQTYTVSPPALTSDELSTDPFIRKSSRYDFAISNSSSTINRSITLTQLNYTLIASAASNFQLTGTNNQFNVRSNARWRISAVTQTPAKAGAASMLNNQSTDNLTVGTTGGPNITSGGDIIRFTTSTTPAYNWGTIDVTFSSADASAPFTDVTRRLTMAAPQLSVYGIGVGDGRYSVWQTSDISENLNTMNMLGATANYGLTTTSKVITPALQVNGTRLDTNPINAGVINNAQNYDVIFFTGATWGDDVSAAINTQLLQRGKTVVLFVEDWQTLRSLMNVVLPDVAGQIYYSTASVNGDGATYQFNDNGDPLINGIFADLRNQYWGSDGGTATIMWGLPADRTVILSNAVNQSGTTSAPPAPLTSMQDAATAFRLRNVNLVVFIDGGFAGTSNRAEDNANTQHWPSKVDTNTWAPIPKTYGNSPQRQVYNSATIANIVAWAAARNPQ